MAGAGEPGLTRHMSSDASSPEDPSDRSGQPPPTGGGQVPPHGSPPYGQPPPYGAPPPPSAPPYQGGPAGAPVGMAPLAARWRRLVARIIDWLVVGIPVGLVLWLATGGYDPNSAGRSWGQEIVYAGVYFLYEGAMLTSRGRTVGKMAMNIRVAMLENGAPPVGQPGWTRAAIYALPPVVPCCGAVFWLVNVAWLLWDKPYRQALHDKAARTVVVVARP